VVSAGTPDGQPWWVMSTPEERERQRQRTAPPYVRWQPTRFLATVTMVLLGVCAMADLASVYAGSRLAVLIDGAAPWAYGGMERLEEAEGLFSVTELVRFAAPVATAIPFLMWFHRSRLNAEAFDAAGQRMGSGWAVGAWFVPVANLWFPKKIANDIWDASTPPGPDGTVRYRVPAGLLNAWWGSWLVAGFGNGVASALYDAAETPGELQDALAFHTVAGGLDVLSALLAVCFVDKLTGMQHTLQAHRLALAARAR